MAGSAGFVPPRCFWKAAALAPAFARVRGGRWERRAICPRFEELCPNAGNSPKILEEAQEILIQCGAVSYCIYELLNRYQTVIGILSAMSLARSESLTSLFEDVAMPACKLFQAVGEAPPGLSILEMMTGWE